MELLLLAAIALLAISAVLLHRRQQAVAWRRELDQAFGIEGARELPRHRAL